MFTLEFFFFTQKTAYEMRISDWSSDVCSSDLSRRPRRVPSPAPPAPRCRPSVGTLPWRLSAPSPSLEPSVQRRAALGSARPLCLFLRNCVGWVRKGRGIQRFPARLLLAHCVFFSIFRLSRLFLQCIIPLI